MAKDKSGNWFGRHKILTTLLALVVLGVVVSAASGGAKDQPTANPSSSPTKKTTAAKESTAKLGQPVRDGKFEFVVKSVDCGKTTVGPNQYLQKNAQGQFCLMDLTVKNIGNDQQYFSESDQKLLNTAKQQYSPDSTATLYNSDNSDALIAQINPGNTVEGVLVFDIPQGQTPVTALLHDSAYSNGASVSLQ